MIKKLHHAAYRCRDSEETRKFYEDFLGMRLGVALPIGVTKTGRNTSVLHTLYEMEDGSFIAFFEDPASPFEFKNQRDFDLHIALEVEHSMLQTILDKGRELGIESRGIADHEFIHSIYFRDPNGYVVELTAKAPDKEMSPDLSQARDLLDQWQAEKG